MENKAHAIAAGAFVLIMGATLVALALWLTRDSGVRRVYEMSTREAVSGLQPQAAVRYRGIDVGKVEQIGFDPQKPGNVLVRIAVDERAPITQSTFATLGYQGVTGLAFVQLDDDGESKEPLADVAGSPPRIPMRPGLFTRITDRGDTLMAEVEKTMAQAQETMARMTELLSRENQTALVATIKDLGAAAKGIDHAAGSVAAVAADVRTTLQTVEATSAQVAKTSTDISDAAAQASATASEFSRQVRHIGDQFADTTRALVSTAGTMNATTLPRVHRVSDDTSVTMRQATRMFNAVSDNPQALLYGGGPIPPGPGEDGFVAPGSRN